MCLNLLQHGVSSDHLAEDGVSAVEPVGGAESDEELTAVGVGASVCHGEESSLVVLDVKVFVRELGSVDGNATSAVVVGEVTTLGHKVLDDSVEGAALVGVLLFVVASARGSKVLGALGGLVCEKLKICFYQICIN